MRSRGSATKLATPTQIANHKAVVGWTAPAMTISVHIAV